MMEALQFSPHVATYAAAFLLLFVVEEVYFRVARRYGIVDRPSRRGSSRRVVLRGGGIIFPLAALLLFCTDGFRMPLFVAGLMLVSLVSFVDDIRSLSPKVRLPIQFAGMLLLLVQLLLSADGDLTGLAGVLTVVVGLIVCTGAMNIFNFMDGINGITGGYSLVALLTLLYVGSGGWHAGGAVPEVSPAVLSLTVWTLLADLVFCFFNFRTRARCFAGDVGSVSIAFIVLFLLGTLIVATRDVTWLVLLVVYGVDGCLTIVHRLLLHEPISQPHRKHAYQLMANELHIPHTRVSLLYMALQAAVNVVFLLTGRHWLVLVGAVLVLSTAYCLFMKKYYHLHELTLKAAQQ